MIGLSCLRQAPDEFCLKDPLQATAAVDCINLFLLRSQFLCPHFIAMLTRIAACKSLRLCLIAVVHCCLMMSVQAQEPDKPAATKSEPSSTAQQPPTAAPAAAPAAVPAAGELPLYPLDLAVNDSGSAFIVDRNLPGVWQWQSDKLSIFFEGSRKFRTPLNAVRCVAIDPQGKLLVGDTATRDIYRFGADGKPEPITGGKIGIPMDMAFKADGTLYVADLELRMLLRIPAGTSAVEQVASVNPRGVFVDSKDQVWVVSQDAAQLLIVADDGQVEQVVSERVFDFPHQVVVNAAGEAFVSDGYKAAIWKVVRGSAPEMIVSGEPLVNPVGLALVEDRVVVVDPATRSVWRLGDNQQLEPWFKIER